MARSRTNFVHGELDGSISDSDTEIESAGLARLPAVESPDIVAITLDPLEADGEPEIVHVTAHASDATVATVLRGQEGTEERPHAAGTEWEHAATAVDYTPDGIGAAPAYAPVVTVDQASYTLAVEDAGATLDLVGETGSVVIPTDASVAIPVGATVRLIASGDGNPVVTTEGGVELMVADGLMRLRTQGSVARLVKLGADNWSLTGDLVEPPAPIYAYVSGTNLRVFDVSDPAGSVLIGSAGIGAAGNGVFVSGDHAYVAAGGSNPGLRVFDVSDQSDPTGIGTSNNFDGSDVFVAGGYAYVTDIGSNTPGLRIFDVSDPSDPTEIGTSNNFVGNDVFVDGGYAYVAVGGESGSSRGLRVYDVSEPSDPTEAFSGSNFNATGVFVAGDYAYVSGGLTSGSGLRIFSVSDPLDPTEIGSSGNFNATGVFVAGDYAYVSGPSLRAFNVSDPSSPTQLAWTGPSSATGVFAHGDLAYLTSAPGSGSNRGLHIFDVTDPSDPVALFTSGNPDGYGVFVVVPGAPAEPTLAEHIADHDNPHQVTAAQVGAPEALGDLADVDASDPSDGDNLAWNASEGQWEPAAGGGVDDPGNVLGGDAGQDAVAVHPDAEASGQQAVAIGDNSSAAGFNGIAIGTMAAAEFHFSGALGLLAEPGSFDEFVIGFVGHGGPPPGSDPSEIVIPGDLEVEGSKNFSIPHPHPDKRDTHTLRHGAYEGPVPGGTIYRYRVTVGGGNATLDLPDYFEHLNTDVDVHISPVKHLGRAYGEVEGNTLRVTADTDGEYAVLILGTRNDPAVQRWYDLGVEKPRGLSWRGHTRTIVEDEVQDGTVVRRRWMAPEGSISEKCDEHWDGIHVLDGEGRERFARDECTPGEPCGDIIARVPAHRAEREARRKREAGRRGEQRDRERSRGREHDSE